VDLTTTKAMFYTQTARQGSVMLHGPYSTTKTFILTLTMLVVITAPANAAKAPRDNLENLSELSGCYVPKGGYSLSSNINQTEQLGLYRIVLMRQRWHQLSKAQRIMTKRSLVLFGAIKGEIINFQPITLAHVLSREDRKGMLYSANDVLDIQGSQCNGNILNGMEKINFVEGTGIYKRLSPGSYIQVQGSVNLCPSDAGYGQNNFEVIANVGRICFNATKK
jgi:hypothetical protein